MIEKPSPLVSDPVFIKGWNAAMSHAEDILVAGAYMATKRSAADVRLLLTAAEEVGKRRRLVPRHYG